MTRTSFLLIPNANLRQPLAAFMEITYFHERRPQFDRTFDVAYHVVDDSLQVLLKEIRLETVERLVQICREYA